MTEIPVDKGRSERRKLTGVIAFANNKLGSLPSDIKSKNSDDDALETRFRAVLPNLLHAYVVPSSSANEREVIAVLKLLSHTAKIFPGVFYHGKATTVLPVIGRILPFFAEPTFR